MRAGDRLAVQYDASDESGVLETDISYLSPTGNVIHAYDNSGSGSVGLAIDPSLPNGLYTVLSIAISDRAAPRNSAEYRPDGKVYFVSGSVPHSLDLGSANFTIAGNGPDITPPEISGMPDDITQSADPGGDQALVGWHSPTATDNVAIASFTSDHPSDVFHVGSTTVTYTAIDTSGNVASASLTVTVINAGPIISGLTPDISLVADPATSSAIATWSEPTATDDDGVASLTSDYHSGDAFPLGSTRVTYIATDTGGRTSSRSFDVNVTAVSGTVFIGMPDDFTQQTDPGKATATVYWTEPTIRCVPCVGSGWGGSVTHIPGDVFPIGTTDVIYTVGGRSAGFRVTVVDEERPLIVNLPAEMVQEAVEDQNSAIVSWDEPTAIDNDRVVSFTSTHEPGESFSLGNNVVTYTAIDRASNVSMASFNVTVIDGQAPVIQGIPANIVQEAEPGASTAVVQWDEPTVADNGEIASFTSDHQPGDTFPLGETTVTYTAIDVAGNAATAMFTVTVLERPQGSVVLEVFSGADGVAEVSSATTELNGAVQVSNGSGSLGPLTLAPGTYDFTIALPARLPIEEANCTGASTINSANGTGTLVVTANEVSRCTVKATNPATTAASAISSFLSARANLILQNGPDVSRRIERFNHTQRSNEVTAYGFGIGQGNLPFSAHIGTDTLSFSYSLDAQRAHGRPTMVGNPVQALGSALRLNTVDEAERQRPSDVPMDLALAPSSLQTTDRAAGDAFSEPSNVRFDAWAEGSFSHYNTKDGGARSA